MFSIMHSCVMRMSNRSKQKSKPRLIVALRIARDVQLKMPSLSRGHLALIFTCENLSCIFPGNYPKLPGIYPVSPILTRDGVKCNE